MNDEVRLELQLKLTEAEREIGIVEDELLRSIPNAFLNLLGIKSVTLSKVVKAHSLTIRKIFDNTPQHTLSQVQKFIELAFKIKKDFGLELDLYNTFQTSFEESFLIALLVVQKIRVELCKPFFAQFQLEKVLSETERSLFGVSDIQLDEFPTTTFQITEDLLIDDYGNFDVHKTIEREKETINIRSFLDSISTLQTLRDNIYTKIAESKHATLAFTHKKELLNLSHICAEDVSRIFIHSVYMLIPQKFELTLAKVFVKRIMQETAIAILNRNNPINDELFLIDTLDTSVSNAIENFNGLNNQNKMSLKKEIFGIVLQLLLQWNAMPENFFSINFRRIEGIENISDEIEYAMDIFLLNDGGINQNMHETYIVSWPDLVKFQIFSIASKKVQNPEYIKEIINKQMTPKLIDRIGQKLSAKALEYNYGLTFSLDPSQLKIIV